MQTKTFRLFISSTFSDFTKEREVLHKKVFPKVDRYCIENGFSFQPVDLRWGVTDEASNDQKTLEVCLEEVRACKHFPYPNFLIMAGDRYGYVPLPYMIEEDEFENILEVCATHIDTNILCKWYKLDKNQIYTSSDNTELNAYILQPRTDEYKIRKNWKEQEEQLRSILQKAADIIFLAEDRESSKEYQKYFTSATEAEVLEGIIDYKGKTPTQEKLLKEKTIENPKVDKEYILGYLRTIENPSKKYVDLQSSLKQKANEFKTNLSKTLEKENLINTNFNSITDYEENELQEFEELIYKKLLKAIDSQKEQQEDISVLQQEILEQQKFQQNKLKGFQGREKTLHAVQNYIDRESDSPLVIYGSSGMGKSSLVAKTIEETEMRLDDNTIVYRFVGATQNSTTIRNLLISVCDELQDKKIIDSVEEYERDSNKFYEQVKEILSSIEKSTIIFVDALDQLEHKEYLQWLPETLNTNLKIIFSLLKDSDYEKDTHYYTLLEKRLDSDYLIDIKNDSLEGSKETLIENLLKGLGRRLDAHQTKHLLDEWKKTEYSPLYLKIAIEEVKYWKSGDKTQELESGVRGIIEEYIINLTKLSHHEELLVKKVFGYIHTSRDGLSEKELLEILSEDLEDEEEFQKKIINAFHEPIKIKNVRRNNNEEHVLPMSIWSRLHTQIKPFIIERNIDNQPLMKFFHRQFTTVIDKYTKETQVQLHTKLSEYFSILQDKTKTWDGRYHNLHMLDELPYQLFKSSQADELKEILFDLEFAGSVFDNSKQDGFKEVMEKASQLEGITEDEVYHWESFYREKGHLITKVNGEIWKPHQSLFQLAYEDGDNSRISKQAEKLIEEEKIEFPWFKRRNRDKEFTRTSLLKVLEGHAGSINGVKVLEDGRILSYSDDETLRLWSKEGDPLAILEGHIYVVDGAKVLKDGRILSYSSDFSLRIWSAEGEPLAVLEGIEGHIGSINGVKVLEDGRILSYSDDETLRLWSDEGEPLAVLEGHTASVNGAKVLDDGRILSYSEDNTLRLWSDEGEPLAILEGHTASVNGAEILEDGRILSYSEDNTLRIWSAEGDPLAVLEGHVGSINGVKVLEDGKILSYSRDKSLRIWSAEGEPLAVLKGHTSYVNGVEVLEDGRILSYTEDFPEDYTLRIWNNEGGSLAILEGHVDSINGAKVLDDGRILSYSKDQTLRIWSNECKPLAVLEGHTASVNGAEILEDGRILSYSDDETLRVWSNDGESLALTEGHTYTVVGVEVLEGGKILSYSRDKTLRLWNHEGDPLAVLEGHVGSINGVKVLEDGRILSYSDDETLRLWSREGDPLAILEGHTYIVDGAKVLEDGRILSYSSDSSLRIWSSEGEPLAVLEGHTASVNGAEILDDGRILSYSRDKTLRIWSDEGDPLAVLEGHTFSVNGVKVLDDGRILSYTEDFPEDYTLRIWSAEGEPLAVLEGHTASVNGAKVLDDGRILSYSEDNTLRLWSDEGEPLAILEGHTNWVIGAEVLEGGRILSYSEDNTLRIWGREGDPLAILKGHIDDVKGVKVLGDGRILSYSRDNTLRIWNNDGSELEIHYLALESVDYHDINEYELIVSDSKHLKIYDCFLQ